MDIESKAFFDIEKFPFHSRLITLHIISDLSLCISHRI